MNGFSPDDADGLDERPSKLIVLFHAVVAAVVKLLTALLNADLKKSPILMQTSAGAVSDSVPVLLHQSDQG